MTNHPSFTKFGPHERFHHYFGIYSPKMDKLGRRVDATSIALYDEVEFDSWEADHVDKLLDKNLKAMEEYNLELGRILLLRRG